MGRKRKKRKKRKNNPKPAYDKKEKIIKNLAAYFNSGDLVI